MADDIARLGYEIDSSQARSAASDLDKLRSVSERVAQSADGIKVSSNGISTAYKAQFASTKQLADIQKRFNANLLNAGKNANIAGVQVAAANRHILNMGFQFQDIGMMLASGQNPLILAMQQGTQVAGIFNQMKMEGQSAFSAIKGGLLGLVNPTSLMTIGVIAGGAALVQWGMAAFGAGEEADALAKKMKEVQENTRALNEELRRMRLGVSADELVLMDAIAAKRAKINELEESIGNRKGRNLRAIQVNIAAEQDELNTLQSQLDSLRDMQVAKDRMIASTRELSDAEREIWQTTQNTSKEAERLTQEIGYAAVKALVLAGVDVTSPISSAAKEAAVLAANLGIALSIAQQIMAFSPTQGMLDEDAAMSTGFDNRGAAAAGRAAGMQYDLAESLKAARKGKKGGGGGGGADKRQAELDAFLASLMTERETLEQWRSEQLELLAQYNDAELMAIGGKNEAKLRLEREYQERLLAIRGGYHGSNLDQMQTFMGEMATALQGGNDKMQRIAQIFAAGEALVNAYRAYNQVLADPSLPWFAKIPAAVSVLAAGMRTVQAIKGATGGGSSAPSSISGTSAQRQPERVVRVDFNGPGWAREMIEPIMSQIYDATKDGTRVVFAR